MSNNNLSTNNKSITFEEIKHSENGQEFWYARELMPLLGYAKWETFSNVIEKAKVACKDSNNEVLDHFPDVRKPIKGGKGAIQNVIDYQLTRYACYLIAMNGDSRKSQIANAQTYFAIQTRKQEIFEELTEDQKRLKIRQDLTDHNKKLFETAKNAGVSNYAEFNDAGYRGLYGMRNKQIAKKKNLGKDKLLDRAGSTELAANLFRITQTDEKLRKDRVNSQKQSEQTHNMIGGKIRQTIKDIGGTMPEDLEPQKHIKEVKKSVKKLTGKKSKLKKLK